MGARQLKIFSGSAHRALAEEIAEFLRRRRSATRGCSGFPDTEVSFQIDENIRGTDVFIVQPTCADVDRHLMELCVMIDAFRRSSASRITAVIPYYGYARQDRKDKPRVPISAKLVANLITAAGANRVLTMDLHKAQIQGFFDIPVDHLFAAPVIIDHLRAAGQSEPDDRVARTPAAPNAPAPTRSGSAPSWRSSTSGAADDGTAEVMNVDRRRRAAGPASCRTTSSTRPGTIVKAATALKANGAERVLACAVHGVLSGPAIERLEAAPIDQVIITNTIPLTTERAQGLQEDQAAVGRAPARAGDSEYSRGDVGLFAVCVS